MEFAKYYDVTDKLNEMIDKELIFSYTKDYCKKLYICSDTHDFWICRILENMNAEYDTVEGKFLVERNKIDKYEFIDFLKEKLKDDSDITSRHDRDYFIDECFDTKTTIENIIFMDDDKGLENWDNFETDSLEEAIEVIDGGYGIIELNNTKEVV